MKFVRLFVTELFENYCNYINLDFETLPGQITKQTVVLLCFNGNCDIWTQNCAESCYQVVLQEGFYISVVFIGKMLHCGNLCYSWLQCNFIRINSFDSPLKRFFFITIPYIQSSGVLSCSLGAWSEILTTIRILDHWGHALHANFDRFSNFPIL